MANDGDDDGDDDWEDEDEEAWDEDEEYDLDDPIYDLQAVRLRPGQKRHLATDFEETLCGRALGYQAKELRGFDARDCQRCFEKASALHLCCADCDKPLLRAGLPGRCRTCQARFEKAVAKGGAGDAPTAEILKQRRVAAAEQAWVQNQRKRDKKAQADAEADWRWRQGLTPARSARPGDPFAWLDQQVSDERFADALDERLFGDPTPLPPGVTAGRELRPGQVRYTVCDATLGYLGAVIVRNLSGDRTTYAADIVGYPDDPFRAAREALLPLATTLQQRLEAGGPVRPIPGVAYRRLATAPVYQPARDVVIHMMGCNRCTAPILMLIHAQPGHNLEDYARDMRPIYQEHTLPTIIAGPPIGENDKDELSADVLPVWPERGEQHRMAAETFGALLETLSQAHCPVQRVLTASGWRVRGCAMVAAR